MSLLLARKYSGPCGCPRDTKERSHHRTSLNIVENSLSDNKKHTNTKVSDELNDLRLLSTLGY